MAKIRMDETRLQFAFDRVRALVQDPEQTQLPSAVLAVGNRAGMLRCEAFQRPGGHPVQPDDIFLLASISKPVTATAIMQLAEDGLLLLSDPVSRYLPEFGQPDKPAVSIWNILTHTSGIDEAAVNVALATAQAPRGAWLDAACQCALQFVPGSRYRYCTLSFFLLGEIVRRLSAMPYPDYLKARILAPLGMVDTSFDPGAANPRAMPVCNMFGLPEPALWPSYTRYMTSLCMPGGGLWSTAADLVAFGRAYLNEGCLDGHRLLAPSTIDQMTREQTAGLVEPINGQPVSAHYALGWGKEQLGGALPGSPRAFGHAGVTGTLLWIDPEWDLVYVFLTNYWGGDGQASRLALQAVYSALAHS